MKNNRFPVQGFHFKFLDDLDRHSSHNHSRANHSIHMKTFKSEHFLYAEPGYDFHFYQDDPKKYSDDKISYVVIPWIYYFRFIDTQCIQRAYLKIGIRFFIHDFSRYFFHGNYNFNIKGTIRLDMINPPIIKKMVAINDGHCRADNPIIECPDVQPPA